MQAELTLRLKDNVEVGREKNKPVVVSPEHLRQISMATVGPRDECQRAFEHVVSDTIMTLIGRTFGEFEGKVEKAIAAHEEEQAKKSKKKTKKPEDKQPAEKKPGEKEPKGQPPAETKDGEEGK